MNPPEGVKELTERARGFAATAKVPMHSGHLLLAVLTGQGTAANTLALHRVTESGIRSRLRDSLDSGESEHAVDQLMETASRIAASFRVTRLSAIHMLCAIATVKDCRGHRILSELGANTELIRNQTMHNMMSSFARDQARDGQQMRIASLPGIPQPASPSLARGGLKPKPEATPGRRRSGVPQSVGKELEQAQKKTRVAQIAPPPASQRPSRRRVVSGKAMDWSRCPLLSALGRNLSVAAQDGEIRPIVGRRAEMEQIADVLNKKRANCPCLVGAPGVGKTAVIEGLACAMAEGDIDGMAFDAIVEIPSGNLLAGTANRGDLSARIGDLAKELKGAGGRVLLFFDDVHELLSTPEAQEAVTELRSLIGRGELPCIFATNDEEFEKHFSDATMARLVTGVEVAEPSIDESREILAGIAPEYEAHHGVQIDMDAIDAAVRLSARYVSGSRLPDKAISVIDLAGAQVKRRSGARVMPQDVAAVLARRIGVPVERLACDDGARLLRLEEALSADIIGHAHVHRALGETLRRNAAGFRSGRPIGSFLFLGPTGVGKTETAKSLARVLFADENAMVRLDMSEFSEPHAVARLLGAPPGYVGHEEGGQLTDAVRRRPYSLILFDEIEKAHRDVIQALLQVLDDGRLTDGRGKTVDFKNTVIIMTSNLGADMRKFAAARRPVGFGNAAAGTGSLRDAIVDAARSALSPELWNRIDEPLVFEPLTQDDVAQIAALMLRRLAARVMEEKQISMAFDDGVVPFLIDAGGYDLQLGARPMRRTIARLVEGPAARLILESAREGGLIRVAVEDNELRFSRVETVESGA